MWDPLTPPDIWICCKNHVFLKHLDTHPGISCGSILVFPGATLQCYNTLYIYNEQDIKAKENKNKAKSKNIESQNHRKYCCCVCLQVTGIKCDLMALRTWQCLFCSHGWQSLIQQDVKVPSWIILLCQMSTWSGRILDMVHRQWAILIHLNWSMAPQLVSSM